MKLTQVNISEKDTNKILSMLTRDAKFFRDNGLMDYSLLLGIEEINQKKPQAPKSDNVSSDGFDHIRESIGKGRNKSMLFKNQIRVVNIDDDRNTRSIDDSEESDESDVEIFRM